MKPYVYMRKIWEDPDMHELAVDICDGRSTFSTDMYLGKAATEEIYEGLKAFAPKVYGGLYDLKIGEFGPEYASGALHLRFGFTASGNGKLFITARIESEWVDWPRTKVASSATLYLRTEPACLDEFRQQFGAMSNGPHMEAMLECV